MLLKTLSQHLGIFFTFKNNFNLTHSIIQANNIIMIKVREVWRIYIYIYILMVGGWI
jgi:hypothetical protein